MQRHAKFNIGDGAANTVQCLLRSVELLCLSLSRLKLATIAAYMPIRIPCVGVDQEKVLMISKIFAPAMMALVLAGCGSIGAIGFPPMNRNAPEPVDPVAVSPVETTALPPISGAPAPGNTGIVGAAPLGTPPLDSTSLNPPPAASSAALGRTDLLGGWTISSSGDSCQLFMTLTSWTGGYRASTRGCSNDILKSISAWNLNGNQVVLGGTGGSPVATLNAAGTSRFDGQTGQGSPVSFYR